MRRDNPNLRNRVDQEAAAMAIPADPQAVLEAIKSSDAGAKLLGEADIAAKSPRSWIADRNIKFLNA